MPATIEEILSGTYRGVTQSVGDMDVVPLLGEDDNRFAPPNFQVSNRAYGTVNVRNTDDRPSILPPGSGWLVNARVQDHAVGGGCLVPGKSQALVKGYCIEQTQPGLITEKQEKTWIILPASLRKAALAQRAVGQYSSMWSSIHDYGARTGVTTHGNLVMYFSRYKKELDEFVAEFELVPKQVGALIFVRGLLVGVEKAPSYEYWGALWEPLIRSCYGSYALMLHSVGRELPKRLQPLRKVHSLSDILDAFGEEDAQEFKNLQKTVRAELGVQIRSSEPEHTLGDFRLRTGASTKFFGQFVESAGRVPYASFTSMLCN